MKTTIFHSILLMVTLIAITCLASGINDSASLEESSSYKPEIAAGETHNQILNEIMSGLLSSKSRSGEISVDSVKSFCIERAMQSVLYSNTRLNYETTRKFIG